MKAVMQARCNRDFATLFRRGKSCAYPLVRIVVRVTLDKRVRYIFIVPSRIEKHASARNLIRRRARAWVQKHVVAEHPGLDVAFIFHKPAAEVGRKQFYAMLSSAVSSCAARCRLGWVVSADHVARPRMDSVTGPTAV